jgi:hypothetical protein
MGAIPLKVGEWRNWWGEKPLNDVLNLLPPELAESVALKEELRSMILYYPQGFSKQ